MTEHKSRKGRKQPLHFTGWLYFCDLTIKWIYLWEFYILIHYSDKIKYLFRQKSRQNLNRREKKQCWPAVWWRHGYVCSPKGHFLRAELCSTFSILWISLLPSLSTQGYHHAWGTSDVTLQLQEIYHLFLSFCGLCTWCVVPHLTGRGRHGCSPIRANPILECSSFPDCPL